MRFAKTIIGFGLFAALACLAQVPYHNSLTWRAQQWKSSSTTAADCITNANLLSLYDVTALGFPNGTLVSNVPDWGPKGYDLLAAGTARPYYTNNAGILNGTNGFLSFDGSTDAIRTNYTVSYPQPTLLIMVARLPNDGSLHCYTDCGGDASVYQLFGCNTSRQFGNAGALVTGIPADAPQQAWQVWTVMFNGASSYIEYRGGTNTVSGNFGANARKGLTIGANRSLDAGTFAVCDVAFCAVYTNLTSSASISCIVGQLMTRFNL